MNKVGDTLIHFGPNEEIVQAFQSACVEFIVIGGLAVAWYCPERQADDMDLLVNPTSENSARISRALAGIHLTGFDERSFTKPGLQIRLKESHYAELLTPRKEGPSYSEVATESVDAKLFHKPVRLASPSLLIRMKEQAVASAEKDRSKHINDIECLKPHAA